MTPYPTITTNVETLDAFGRKCFLSERDVYQEFLNITVAEMLSTIGYLHLYDSGTEEIELAVWSDGVFAQCTTSHVSHYPLRMAGIWADGIREKRVVIHNDYPSSASKQGLPEGHFPVLRHASSPIWGEDSIEAVLGIGNREDPYTDEDATRFFNFLHLGWPVLKNRLGEHKARLACREETFRKVSAEETLTSMLRAVGRSLELRDEYTSQHQSNVSYIADKIAEHLELPIQQRFGIRVGSLIHDIGKIAIPSQVLNKPGKLFPAELELIKMHPMLGADIFRSVELPWPIVQMIEQHHERMDGTGYPYGLIGDTICLEARILAVADTFDAMASDRPYRHAPGRERAIEAIKAGRAILYDPYIVDAFLIVLESDAILQGGGIYK